MRPSSRNPFLAFPPRQSTPEPEVEPRDTRALARAHERPPPAFGVTGVVDDGVLVDDDRIVAAIRRAHADLGVVLQPADAAGLAAVMAEPERFRGQLVGVILSGGDATSDQLREWLAP